MKLSELESPKGANKNKKRRGRGESSGHGKTSCRGNKGARARSGAGGTAIDFEGGQTPLVRRMPKRGFTSEFKVKYEIVNVSSLNVFDAGSVVSPAELAGRRLVSSIACVKILGNGELKKSLTVKAHKFAASAIEKIKKAGGKADLIS